MSDKLKQRYSKNSMGDTAELQHRFSALQDIISKLKTCPESLAVQRLDSGLTAWPGFSH